MEPLFAPPAAGWQRISPRLTWIRRGLLAGAVSLALAAVVALRVITSPPGWLLLVGLVVLASLFAWAWWVIGRSAAAWGYAELDEELYITRGVIFRRLVVVPYGRMQYVDVQAGPLDQLNGIAKVHLHTASPGTSAVIPGLPAAEAARLRDRLTSLGESHAAGL